MKRNSEEPGKSAKSLLWKTLQNINHNSLFLSFTQTEYSLHGLQHNWKISFLLLYRIRKAFHFSHSPRFECITVRVIFMKFERTMRKSMKIIIFVLTLVSSFNLTLREARKLFVEEDDKRKGLSFRSKVFACLLSRLKTQSQFDSENRVTHWWFQIDSRLCRLLRHKRKFIFSAVLRRIDYSLIFVVVDEFSDFVAKEIFTSVLFPRLVGKT